MEAGDNEFGPFFRVPGAVTFDFTLLFEDTILSILPSCLLLLTAPLRIVQLWRTSRKVRFSALRTIKLLLLIVFTTIQVISLCVWALKPEYQTRASVSAAALLVIVALGLCALSMLEHSRSIRPSFVIGAYILLTLPLDAAKVRTLWIRAGPTSISSITSISLVTKIAILIAEAVEKRKILLPQFFDDSPENTSSLFSRGFFWWLNPLFLLGLRKSLNEDDLFSIDERLSARLLHQRLATRWNRSGTAVHRHRLLLSVIRCMLRPLAVAVFPRLCQSFFQFMQPLLIRRVTIFVDEPDSQAATNNGWGLVAAYGLVYAGIALSVAMYNYQAYRIAAMVRGALVTTIYSRTLSLSISALDESAAVTLMSTDVQRLSEAVPLFHELWACPLEIGVAMWLLTNELGLAVVGPVIVSILSVSLIGIVVSRMAQAQKTWLALIESRVSVTSRSLQAIKTVKMLGLTSVLSELISTLRQSEITSSFSSRRLMAISIICGNIADVCAPAGAFVIYVIISQHNGQQLTATLAYTVLSLISLLANPTKILINFAIPRSMIAISCFDRIQDYLESASRHDTRLLTHETVRADSAASVREGTVNHLHKNSYELEVLSQHGELSTKASAKAPSIQVEGCSLKWKEDRPNAVENVSFKLYSGLTMLVGPVGCGKSSLVRGLLGEIEPNKGNVTLDTPELAFVDQSSWLHHGSIRENIVGMSIFEHEFYSKVVHACALDNDLSDLKEGDATQVGSAGSGLSGGQKLRVALARAVYSRKNILILDDVFSGLDAGSEDRIFSLLLGKRGILRELDITILLVTHAVHRLSYADHIIAMNKDGTISEQGTLDQLMTNKGYVAELAARHATEDAKGLQDEAILTKVAVANTEALSTAENDLDRPVGDWAVYKFYFTTLGYKYVTLFLVLMILFAFCAQFPALWLTFWTKAVGSSGNKVNNVYLGGLIGFNAAALIALASVLLLAYTAMVPRSALRLHTMLLNSVRNAPLHFLTSTETGKVVNRFSQDMNIVDFELTWALVEFTASACIAIMQAVFICLSAAYFTAIMPVVLGLMYLIQKFYLRTSRQVRLIDLEAKSPLYSNFIETLNGLVTIRAFGWTADLENRNYTLLDASQQPYYLFFCIQRWLSLVLDLTVAGLAVVLMILIVTLRERLQAGLVGVALLNIMNFNLSLTQVIQQWTTLETSLGAIARVKSFVAGTPTEHLVKEDQTPPKGWPMQGAIAFHDVSASYAPEGPLILRDINLSIPSGQKIGIVGRSGSGKSSLITSLLHMLIVRQGIITIDGQQMDTTSRESWRQGLNPIPQEPLFLHGSIRSNLDPHSRTASDEPLIASLKRVGLWDTITKAGGLDTEIHPEKQLSYGQRQLFCVARAIINRSYSRILILDESTASVDVATDAVVQRIVREDFKDLTIIAVAHRLQTVVDFDRILVLDQGRIVEDGVPQELLADQSSWFRKLWNSRGE